MWELIRANQRKSTVLFLGMALCLMALGYLTGAYLFPPDGGVGGIFTAIVIWLFMSFLSIFAGDAILLSLSRAHPVTHDVHPQLYNVTEEMRIAANLPVMPRLYILNERAPNAFATGVDPRKSAIVVTSGLLASMNRDELQGVIAHEMAHILNRDVRFMTMAGIMLGSITMLAEVFLRSLWYSGSSRRHSGSRRSSSGQGQVVIMIIAVVFAISAPILARLFYFAISRKREYLADATAARLTRYPEGLASALEKIAYNTEELTVANKITAPMYICNPLKKRGRPLSDLTSTHPPVSERIKILRRMVSGAGYIDYQEAYNQARGRSERLIPSSGLKDKDAAAIRKPTAASEPVKSAKVTLRDISDLSRAASGFIFVGCACGVKFKIPPDFKKSRINCPHCHRSVDIPLAGMTAAGAVLEGVRAAASSSTPAPSPTLTYVRRTSGWETIPCSCGNLLQISPLFAGTSMRCPKCLATINIQAAS
jgi:heat shock protein HtpX